MIEILYYYHLKILIESLSKVGILSYFCSKTLIIQIRNANYVMPFFLIVGHYLKGSLYLKEDYLRASQCFQRMRWSQRFKYTCRLLECGDGTISKGKDSLEAADVLN